jgi:tRNA1Val (adenine37-N6)-methyltransferase
MKVSTDCCLFGAWISRNIIPSLPEITHALDIGAGTGLLMMMMAQEHHFAVDGIELNEDAYQQALSNINASDWKTRLSIFHGDVRGFNFDKTYDLIISNPPFYENDLMSPSASKASAMHDTTLRFEELLAAIDVNLISDGYFALLIPFHRFEEMKALCLSKGFYLHKAMHVRHQEQHAFIRSMVLLSRIPADADIQIIAIKEKDGTYTSDFKELLKKYYLHL